MYRSIETSMWSDPAIRNLSPIDKLLFVYLITNSHAHLSGLYYIQESTIGSELGVDLKVVKKGLDTLSIPYRYPIDGASELGLLKYDQLFQVVFVKNMLMYQGRGHKIKKSVEEHFKTLHKCPLINDLCHHYRSWGFRVSDTPSIPHRYPIDTPSGSGTGTGSGSGTDKDLNKNLLRKFVDETKTDEIDAERGMGIDDQNVPNCPYQKIVDLYHQILPMCMKVKILNETRKKYLRVRWAEDKKRQHLDWWRNYFEYISKSKFLTGGEDAQNGRRVFCVDLEWVVRPTNFVKIIEGKYHA